jgi:RNA polymerase sigma factor (sigma-70 family)
MAESYQSQDLRSEFVIIKSSAKISESVTPLAPTVGIHDEQLALNVSQQLSLGRREEANKAFMLLYDRHAKPLWAFVVARVSRSDADDINQEIWQRVWQYLPTRFHGGNFRAWLYEIARNYLIDCSRRRKNNPQLISDTENAGYSFEAGESALERAEEAAILARCLEKLTAHDATASQIVRGRLAGESYAKICELCGVAEDRAYSLFHQAKKLLIGCVERALS